MTSLVREIRRDVRKDATTVLLEHPWRTTKTGAPMPILALGEHGNGRSIALAIDGSHRLLFSAFAANAAGRAHGAFWDAMLGWLMRDPRFEPAVIERLMDFAKRVGHLPVRATLPSGRFDQTRSRSIGRRAKSA